MVSNLWPPREPSEWKPAANETTLTCPQGDEALADVASGGVADDPWQGFGTQHLDVRAIWAPQMRQEAIVPALTGTAAGRLYIQKLGWEFTKYQRELLSGTKISG